jgi:hypothetical protein
MYFHLLLLSLHFHFSISSGSLESCPHAINERQVTCPGQLSAPGEPRKQPKSANPWSNANYLSKDIIIKNQRPILEARAGGVTAATDLLGKQWAKKIRQATSKWETSVNGKALKALFLKEILPSPYVSVTQCLAALSGSPIAHIWEQLAVLESLLQLVSTYPSNRWMIVGFSSDNFIPDQKHPFERSKVRVILERDLKEDEAAALRSRGYTYFQKDDWWAVKDDYLTTSTFGFAGSGAPGDICEIISSENGVSPSVYLGPSPPFMISDTMKRPSYVCLRHYLLACC